MTTKLWIPGPTEVRPAILAACAEPMIGHRAPEMRELIARIDPHLPHAFGLAPGSSARCAVASTSASGVMEGALLGCGARILGVVNGAFSKRWHEMARLLGKDAVALDVDWGATVTPQELHRVLAEQGPFDAVTVVANETSTGVCTPIGPLAAARDATNPETLLLVDVVSLLAGAPVDFDANGADLMLAGVQKALALPPGLTVFCASARYVERARERPNRGWFLDPVRLLEGHEARKTPATPCIPLYRALANQLEDITAGATLRAQDAKRSGRDAWQARYEKHERMRDRTLQWAQSRALEPFPREGLRSPTVACLRSGSIDVELLIAGLVERGLRISNGYGPLKGATFRIGHMGDHDEDGLEELLGAIDAVLASQPARR